MRKVLISMSICLAMFATQLYARHNTGEIMFTSILKGNAEVPAVKTDARGVVTFNLNSTMDTLFINGTFAGLSGKITGAHIHEAEIGSNGGVIVGLTSFINKNQIMGFVTGESLTKSNLKAMLDGKTYLNIHTAKNPNGEIRGQLMSETDFSFFSTLSTNAEVPPVSGNAEGFANVVISKTNKRIWVNVVYSGTTGAITGAHLHNAMAGMNGGVVVNLTDLIDGNRIVGSVEIDENLDLWSKLSNEEVYINLHTEANPGGELRGDLKWIDGITLRTELDSEQEIPVPLVPTTAKGNGYIHFNNSMDSLNYMIYFEGLTGEAVAAHFHLGESGVVGAPVVDITSDINGSWIVGTKTGASITNELIQNFLKGNIYVNIHTLSNAAGEIRGQVLPNTRIGITTLLEGEQENPGVRTKAYGSGSISISNSLNDIWYSILADSLSGEVKAAHFHNAEIGMNGDVVLGLDNIDQGKDNGVWIEGSNASDINSEIGGLFVNDKIYVNMHTENFPSGELRGQLDLYAKLYFDNGILPFNPMYSGRIAFHSMLSSENEVHSVKGKAYGSLGIVLSPNMDSLYFNAAVNNLSGEITGAHFHKGSIGEDGPVDVNLTSYVNGNVIAGTITDFDLAAVLSGQYYLNVHTLDNPAGEVRGQVMLNSDWAFTAMLSAENETHSVTSDAKGMAIVRVYPDMNNMEIKVLFDGMSSAVTGAHLHKAPAGQDGEVVINLTDDINGNTIITNKMNSTIIADLIAGNIYLNIHTENNGAGEIRGQLELQDGLFFDTWLNGAQENPPTATNAKGLATAKLEIESGELIYNVFTAGLSGEITGTHIHEASIGANGGVLINLTSGILGNLVSGVIDLSADLKTNIATMLKGEGYLNVHTEMFANGEIRGQLRSYNRETFAFNLTSEQEVPSVNNNTTGTGVVSINNSWDMLTVDVSYTGLEGKIIGAHIHQAEAGANGDVIINLSDFIDEETQTIRGNITAEGGLNSSAIEAILSGEAYINIHTEENPNGETRGQINNTASLKSQTSVYFIDLPNVNLYPNPTTSSISLSIGEYISNNMVEIRVYDRNGRMSMKKTELNTGYINLDVSKLLSGLYFVEIRSESSNIRAKFIKQ